MDRVITGRELARLPRTDGIESEAHSAQRPRRNGKTSLCARQSTAGPRGVRGRRPHQSTQGIVSTDAQLSLAATPVTTRHNSPPTSTALPAARAECTSCALHSPPNTTPTTADRPHSCSALYHPIYSQYCVPSPLPRTAKPVQRGKTPIDISVLPPRAVDTRGSGCPGLPRTAGLTAIRLKQ